MQLAVENMRSQLSRVWSVYCWLGTVRAGPGEKLTVKAAL